MTEREIKNLIIQDITVHWVDEEFGKYITMEEAGIITAWLEDNADDGLMREAANLVLSCYSGYEEVYGDENMPSDGLIQEVIEYLGE